MTAATPLPAIVPEPVDEAFARYLRDPPRVSYVQPEDSLARSVTLDTLERLCGRRRLQGLYRRLKQESSDASRFFADALELARIRLELRGAPLATIPRQGPLVFVANHPFGIADGLAFCHLAQQVRGDFRILIHAMLCQDRDLAPYFLPIDFSGSAQARRSNIRAKQLAMRALERDIPVLVFPSGGVSTRGRFGFGALADLPWTTFAAKLISSSRATVVPTFFHGSNGRLFHVASHIAAPLRLALLLHETRRRFDQTMTVTLGEPIPYDALAGVGGRQALTDHLHQRTWALGA